MTEHDSPPLRVQFSIHLTSERAPSLVPIGPLFHRWIPDGRTDAVNLTVAPDPIRISVWFERRTRLNGAFLEWDRQGQEFDPEVMRRQYKLDAGILYGEVVIANVSWDEHRALRAHAIKMGESFGQHFAAEDATYVAFGRRLIKALQPPLAGFMESLRTMYGQYWLQAFPSWDSRRETLGHYCSSLGLKWIDEPSGDKYWFLPTNSGGMFTIQRKPMRGALEYLTEEDWRRIQKTPIAEDATSALQFLSLAHTAIAAGNVRHAFVETRTAIEFIVWHKLKRARDPQPIEAAINGLLDRTPLRDLVAATMRLCGFSTNDIEIVLSSIITRNKIVHEGEHPSSDEIDSLRSALAILATLAGLPEFKQPVLDSVNRLGPPGGQ